MATKSKIGHVDGNFSQVALNGHVVALLNQNKVVELWDAKLDEKIFESETRQPAKHVMFKFGKFIVSIGDQVIEFIDCDKKVSVQAPHKAENSLTHYADEKNQVLVTFDVKKSQIVVWQPTRFGGITQNISSKPFSPALPLVHPLKIAVTKDLLFVANDRQHNEISVYKIDPSLKFLYRIQLLSSVRALLLCEPYLFASLRNGTVAIINYNW